MNDPVKIEIPAELDRELDALSVQSGREKWLLATQALSTFLDNKLNNQSSLDMFKTMHDVAGKYHLHYSTVRTTATSLVLPIGILASVTLLVACPHGGVRVPIRLLIFIIISTLFLNILFAKWSRACRHIERYYEGLMAQNAVFDANVHGFRHLFRFLIRGAKKAGLPAVPVGLNTLSSWNPKVWIDPFVLAILILGFVYLYFYDFMYRHVCH